MMNVLLVCVALFLSQIVICFGHMDNLISNDEVAQLLANFGSKTMLKDDKRKIDSIFDIFRQIEYLKWHLIKKLSLVKQKILCHLCIAGLKMIAFLSKIGIPQNTIIDKVSTLCYTLHLADFEVCSGIMRLNVPIIIFIIKNTPEATAESFCAILMQNDDLNVCSFADKRFEWQVELPESKKGLSKRGNFSNFIQRRNTLKSTKEDGPLKIVVLTDPHLDPTYEPNGVAACDEPICCRKGQHPSKPASDIKYIDDHYYENAILHNGDESHLNLSAAEDIRKAKIKQIAKKEDRSPAGYWGDYRNCDTPLWAFDDLIDRIKDEHDDIDLIYFVGDSVDHGIWMTTYEHIHTVTNHTINKIRDAFGDDIMVVPTIGNHESLPINQFAPNRVTQKNLNTSWLLKALADKWDFYLPEDAKKSLIETGHFTILFKPGFRIISFNNNVAYYLNWWLMYDPSELKKHLQWLVDKLYAAEQAGERVHIITHIPPGISDLVLTWTREYNRVINRFSSIIMAEFNGHTHSDEFKVFYSLEDPTQAINVAWNVGGATTYIDFNLNYKFIKLDEDTYAPRVIKNYVYNLTEANLHPDRKPRWYLLYNMHRNFNLPDLSAPSINELLYKMVTTEKQLLTLYSTYYAKNSDLLLPGDEGYRLDILCKTVVTVLWQKQKCEELIKLYEKN